jgi:hypothetical protein
MQAGITITVASLLACISYEKHELTVDATKLATTENLHAQDQQRIADLGKELADQNNAVTALKAQQAVEQAQVATAIKKAQTQQQKGTTLLVSTGNQRPSTCEQAIPEVRAIIKGLQQ